jgi:hypothetical protein
MVLRVAEVVLLAAGEVAAVLVVTIFSRREVPVEELQAAVAPALLAKVLVMAEL